MPREKFPTEREGARRSKPSRSRSRSRSRRPRSRSRTRQPARSLSRRSLSRRKSRSRSLSRRDGPLDVGTFQEIISKQQDYITSLISSQKRELEEKIEASSTFRNKGNQKQYEFNSQILNLVNSSKTFLKDKDGDKALDILRDIVQKLDEQNENIQIADSSKFGWLTVFKLRGKDCISSSVKKKVDKIETSLERHNVRSNYKKSGNDDSKGKHPKNGVQTERQEKRGPEETLLWLKTRKRTGICTHCTESGHFWRECPQYWPSVNTARKQDA